MLPCTSTGLLFVVVQEAASGVVVLEGGGPFVANDALDRRVLSGVDRVIVLPTADAFEQPGLLVEAARAWGVRIGVVVEPLMVLTRAAADDAAAAVVDGAPSVVLAGDSASHLRSVLKDTPLMAALERLIARGGTLIACGPSANAICDPMTDQRGGGFAIGLGLVRGVAVVAGAEQWPREQLDRAHALADTALVDLPTGSAIVRRPNEWELVGEAAVRGELPLD
jgi:cyanophycinase